MYGTCQSSFRIKPKATENRKGTGKTLTEAPIFASTNPQYDNRLFIVHVNCKLRIPAKHVVYTNYCCCLFF